MSEKVWEIFLNINPIIEPIAAVSAGILDGEVIVDLDYAEDFKAQVDSNIVMTQSGKIIDFQTTAEELPYEYEKMLEIFSRWQNDLTNGIIGLANIFDPDCVVLSGSMAQFVDTKKN